MAHELDEKPIFQLIHSMLRRSGEKSEIERTEQVMQWVSAHRENVYKVTQKEEMRTIALIWKAWRDTGHTPIRTSLEELMRMQPQQGALIDLLNKYDSFVDAEVVKDEYTHADMSQMLQMRIADWEKRRLTLFLEISREIVNGEVENQDRMTKAAKPKLSGCTDALGFLYSKLQSGWRVTDGNQVANGVISHHTHRLSQIHNKGRAERESGQMFIPTGIDLIDSYIGGNQRKDLVGLLGYTGQRKSAVLRTMGYYAARAGFYVMHVPLESDFDEEMAAYLVMHAYANAVEMGWTREVEGVSVNDLRSGRLSDQKIGFLMDVVRADFDKKVGQNITMYEPRGSSRTWVDVKAAIERECIMRPVDLCLIDYLTIINPGDPNVRDRNVAINNMIIDAKQFAMTANNGMGFSLVTPIQGSRKGYEEAAKNDGAWTKDGIYMFSEYERSVDILYYVYTNPDMSKNNELKFGSCKMRRALDIDPSFVTVNPRAGMIEKANSVVIEQVTRPQNTGRFGDF
jgi:hypothetical protein